ncbi:MAG: hypothetical protein IBX36_03410 [Dehalococcoidia bacterium]|nr:hypothetical protein [Dehalococcoidia bacterium]
MLKIEALWVDDEVLDKIEGKHGVQFMDIEEALVYSKERCFHKVGGGQLRVLLKTSSGGHVAAFLSHIEKGDWKLNSAREMTPKEKRLFKLSKKG